VCGPRVELHCERFGALAQLGERRLCKAEVAGSIPARSTHSRAAVSRDSVEGMRGPNRRFDLGDAVVALRVPSYRAWFLSQVLSTSGVFVQAVGVAWLVLQLGGNAIDLALVSAATFSPVFVGGAWAGGLADRVDRRRLLLTTQFLFLLVAVCLLVVSRTGVAQLWILYALSFVSGCVLAIDGPARQVYPLDLVGTDRAASAVGLYEVVQNLSRVLGPALGGLLIATSGVSACFLANAVSFLFPIAALLRYRPDAGPEPAVPASGRGHVRAGLGYVRRSRAIRATMLMAIASGMVFNAGVTLPLLATRTFHLGPTGFGAMFAIFGVGAVGGALLAAGGGSWPTGRRVRLLALLTGADVVLTGLAPDAAAAFVGLTLAGLLSIWFIALANTLVQVRTAPAFRGRVMGIWTMALPGMNPVTGLLAGVTAVALGPRAGFALGGVALALTAALGWGALADGRR
jgi:MFS family permease